MVTWSDPGRLRRRGIYKGTIELWVPGHLDVLGNEKTDRLTNRGINQGISVTPCSVGLSE